MASWTALTHVCPAEQHRIAPTSPHPQGTGLSSLAMPVLTSYVSNGADASFVKGSAPPRGRPV